MASRSATDLMSGLARMATIAGLALAAMTPRAEGAERFSAVLFDGSLVTAARFENDGWWSDNARLRGRLIFGTDNPLRMLHDTTRSLSRKAARVVMANGDVLPGEVAAFLPPSPEENLPARLLVSLAPPLVTADPRGLAVRADRVLGLTSTADDSLSSEPGTLRPAHRGNVLASAVRWTDVGVKALTPDGVVTVPFREIAHLHVPKVDVLGAVLDDGVYPPLGPGAVVARLETADGAILTYHREMTLLAASRTPSAGGPGGAATSYLHLQPSWALEAILAPVESMWRQSFRAAREVPLSLLPATVLKQKAGLHQWPWRRNQNVEGGPLWSGRFTVDLGVGTHSYCEIAFQLPPRARDFTTLLGLDRSVDRGACAVCKIYQDQVAGKPLFTSGFLRGMEEPIPVGPLRVDGAKRLVLVTEFGDEGRPPGAYPLDMGDHVDWLMPFVTFEENANDRRESLKRFLPGCEAWDVDAADVGRLSVGLSWDTLRERWLPLIRTLDGKPLKLTRTVSGVSGANQFVELVFANAEQLPLPKVELRADGIQLEPAQEKRAANSSGRDQSLAESDPKQNPTSYEIRTVRWDLPTFREQTVQLALTISFDKNPLGLRWHGLTVKSATGTRSSDSQSIPPDGR